MIPLIAIVGRPKSGKTGVMVKLIAELKKRGYRVAAVKHAHETVELDVEGKDTWRFARAGSDATAVSSPDRLTIFMTTKGEPTLEQIMEALGNSYDIVLMEGFKKFKLPKIEVLHDIEPVCSPQELLAVVTDDSPSLNLPHFRKDDIKSLADFIEKNIIRAAGNNLSLSVNGKQILLKPFVRDIIGRAVIGMVSTLKNTGIIRTINISLRAGDDVSSRVGEF